MQRQAVDSTVNRANRLFTLMRLPCILAAVLVKSFIRPDKIVRVLAEAPRREIR
jgi:hypothetical protein